MGLRRPEFRLTSGVRRVGGRQSVGGPHGSVSTITDDASGDLVSMVTCTAPHGLTAANDGAAVTIAGTVVYDGTFKVQPSNDGVFVSDPTTQFLLYDNALAPVVHRSDTAGGTWTL